MKSKNSGIQKIKKIIFPILVVVGTSLFLYAGGGHDHSHGDEQINPVGQLKYFSSEWYSDKYELLMRYESIQANEPVQLSLFVSEYETNKPIDNAEIQIQAQEDPSIVFTIKQKAEGHYLVESVFPQIKQYSLVVKMNGSLGPDLILLKDITTGLSLETDLHAHDHTIFGHWLNWILLLLALLAGLGIGAYLQKRKLNSNVSSASYFLFLCMCIWPVQEHKAHGDDNHGAGQKTGNFSSVIDVPKETQFLFEVLTQKINKGSFNESTKLFGTIIPGTKGQAFINTPVSGTIQSLYVHVGQHVRSGQLLAQVLQNMDAEAQINLLAEKNRLTAEYEAAKKENERLQTVKDIVAKKELDEAKSRLQKVESNLQLLKSSGGKIVSLKAPIDGIISNFNFSSGSTVNAAQTLFTILNPKHIYAEAQVFDRDVAKVEQGIKFTIECSNDDHKTSDVKLLSFTQQMNPTNQTQKVLFELNNNDQEFKIGEFVNIRVFTARNSNQMVLPNAALTEINGKPVVFVKEAAEKYAMRYVQTGENNGSFTSISKGITEGERIVIHASYQLKMIYLNQ
jgi:membrane fusion protein, heavy metal efflux system